MSPHSAAPITDDVIAAIAKFFHRGAGPPACTRQCSGRPHPPTTAVETSRRAPLSAQPSQPSPCAPATSKGGQLLRPVGRAAAARHETATTDTARDRQEGGSRADDRQSKQRWQKGTHQQARPPRTASPTHSTPSLAHMPRPLPPRARHRLPTATAPPALRFWSTRTHRTAWNARARSRGVVVRGTLRGRALRLTVALFAFHGCLHKPIADQEQPTKPTAPGRPMAGDSFVASPLGDRCCPYALSPYAENSSAVVPNGWRWRSGIERRGGRRGYASLGCDLLRHFLGRRCGRIHRDLAAIECTLDFGEWARGCSGKRTTRHTSSRGSGLVGHRGPPCPVPAGAVVLDRQPLDRLTGVRRRASAAAFGSGSVSGLSPPLGLELCAPRSGRRGWRRGCLR